MPPTDPAAPRVPSVISTRWHLARGIDPVVGARPDDPEPAPSEWVEASAVAMPLADRSVDVVVSGQVLQFVPEVGAAAREIRRVLKPGGRAAVSVFRGVTHNPYFAAPSKAGRCGGRSSAARDPGATPFAAGRDQGWTRRA